MAFEKIEKRNVADRVFNALRGEILGRRFQIGDKLPSEGELSVQFGVSKASIKSALQRLSTLGLIETRVGQGSFVREFNPNAYMNQMHEFLLSDSDISHVTEYRMYLEMAITRLAIKNARENNFQNMENLLHSMEEALQRDDIELHGELDYEFHLEICRASQNPIFVVTYETIGKMIREHATILNKEYYKKIHGEKMEDDVHWHLLQAIKKKDIETCRKCYLRMFSVFKALDEGDFADA
jgi:GntR family transcriptional repressor for pyruvate dehydrogenase complex